MTQRGVELNQERFSCSICLDLLKDPVTIPCGHNYCMSCIQTHWDGQSPKKSLSCPQCRQSFRPRPVLVKNTLLADVVEQLKSGGLAVADHCYAGPEDVACDLCTNRKRKASKSCLQCLVSYCHKHLQPHHDVPQFKKHKLVEPSQKLHENVCSRHDEPLKMFCRSDQQCICYLCSVDQHKDHDTVTCAAGRSEKQTELEASRRKMQQKIKDKRKDLKALQQEAKAIRRSADEALDKSHQIFNEMIRLMEERRRHVEWQIRAKEDAQVGGVKELESKLEQEVSELRRKDAEMDQLSHTDDHNQFLLQYPSVSSLSQGTDSDAVHLRPLNYLDEVMTAVTQLRDQLLERLKDGRTSTDVVPSISSATPSISGATPSISTAAPHTRAQLMPHSCTLTLDPNTVSKWLSLSRGNTRATVLKQHRKYPDHPHRFSHVCQALSKESLSGPCYWEVELKAGGRGVAYVAVASKDIHRKGSCDECKFGFNDKSWALCCSDGLYEVCHNRVRSPVPVPGAELESDSSRVGVFLDQAAGVLSFYRVSEGITLLHTVHHDFPGTLHAGVWIICTGDTVELVKLK